MRVRYVLPIVLAGLCWAQTYSIQASHTTESLRGVSAVSREIVWASGTHGTYLRTLDSGIAWTPAQVPGAEALDFRDVEAFSANEAYLLAAGPGEQSRIYKTSNGGKTWDLQFTNREPKGFFDCMAFWDSTHGIAVGDPVGGKFELIETNDGKTWQPLPSTSLPSAVEGEGAFAASGTCIAVRGDSAVWFTTGGKVARVFRSPDRGKTWSVAETPLVQGSDSSGSFSIAFADDKHGVISGGDYKHPEQERANLAYTEDGGATWKLSPVQHPPFLSAVGYLEPSSTREILAVGSTCMLFAVSPSQDASLTFHDVSLNALSLSGRNAWAVGPKGVIARWVDGGADRAGKN